MATEHNPDKRWVAGVGQERNAVESGAAGRADGQRSRLASMALMRYLFRAD